MRRVCGGLSLKPEPRCSVLSSCTRPGARIAMADARPVCGLCVCRLHPRPLVMVHSNRIPRPRSTVHRPSVLGGRLSRSSGGPARRGGRGGRFRPCAPVYGIPTRYRTGHGSRGVGTGRRGAVAWTGRRVPRADRSGHRVLNGLLCASHWLGMLSNNQPRELAL